MGADRAAILRPLALADIGRTAWEIGQEHIGAGAAFPRAVRNAVARLERMPGLGHPYPTRRSELRQLRTYAIPGYRSYLVLYLVRDGRVHVLRVVHGARNIAALRLDAGGTDLRMPDE
jgi:toxin ParE1/3/4